MKHSDSQRQPALDASAALAPAPETELGYAPPDYDPSQYRWVPVRRRPRSDGWTEEKQRRFIEVLADTGLVTLAAREVGMTRMSAYRLRRAPYAAAFARAWDVARERAGTLIEDIAFERAIEGVEQEVYDGHGELKGSRTIYNDRLLTFLLRHLKPERYGREAREAGARARPDWTHDGAETDEPQVPRELPAPGTECAASLDDALRAMEPAPPAPADALLDPGQLESDLLCAEIADGKLPDFLSEQRAARSPGRLRAEEVAAQIERGRLADAKLGRGEPLSDAEFEDFCVYCDPEQATGKRKKRHAARRSEA